MSYFGNNNPKSAMGELEGIEPTPVVQMSAQYGLLPNVFTVVDDSASGSTYTDTSKFVAETGTSPDAIAAVLSQKHLYVKAGQGGSIILDIMFDSPVADCNQFAGLINSEDTLAIAYIGEQFGILHSYLGVLELLKLEFTSSGSGSATVTIDDVAYPITLTAGTIEHNAYEVASQLNGVIPNYTVTSNEGSVKFHAGIPSPKGNFSYSGVGTTTFTRLTTGADAIQDFIPVENFNGNLFDGYDAQKLNYYKITFDGNINFYVQNPDSNEFDLMHSIKYINSHTMPHTGNSAFRGGWVIRNSGNTVSKKIQGSKLGMFVQGKNVISSFLRSESNTLTGISSASEQTIFTFRNRREFNSKSNRSNIYPRNLSLSTDSAKGTIFKVYAQPVFSGELTFKYLNEENSITEFSKDNTSILGGGLLSTLIASQGSGVILEFKETNFDPGVTITITAQKVGGSTADATLSLTWVEDL
jgi:hypothetical protein